MCNQIADRMAFTRRENGLETVADIGKVLMKHLTAQDNARPRTKQTTVGVSSLGGCRRQAWHMLQGDIGENTNTLRLASIMGTAIHKTIEDALPFGEFEKEIRVQVDGLPVGNVDLYIPKLKAVVDWKTTTLKKLDYFPSRQQRWQVHVYGYLLTRVGKEVETVTLVAIPRDGDERYIKIHTEPYSEAIALEALQWLEELQDSPRPKPERDALTFCKNYCKFYGSHCGGL